MGEYCPEEVRPTGSYALVRSMKHTYNVKQHFGQIKNELFLKNELFIKDPEGVNLRSARPSASYNYLLYPDKRA